MNRPIMAAFVLLWLASAWPAAAHDELVSAIPPVDASVQTSPTEVSITFSEEVEARFSSIQVLNANGKRVDLGAAHTALNDAKVFSVSLKPLTPGKYKVIWQAVSVDTHKTKGTYQFTYKP